jgi:hypothetical protein
MTKDNDLQYLMTKWKKIRTKNVDSMTKYNLVFTPPAINNKRTKE